MAEERAVGGTGAELASSWRRRARNPEAVDAGRLMDGAAWEEFCDALRAAGRRVLASPATSELDRAEGFRHLATLVSGGLRHVFDLADVERPRFLRNPDSTSKFGAENADNQYLLASIDPRRSYRIQGRRNSAWAFLLEIKEGYMQLGDARNFATLHSDDLQVEADGSFEIALSAQRQPGNWVPLHPDASQVLFFTILLYCYVVIYLGVGRLLLMAASRVVQVTLPLSLLVQVLMLLLGCGVPLIIYWMSDLRLTGYSQLHISNPFFTLFHIVDRNALPLEAPSLAIILGPLAALIFLLNLPSIAAEVRNVRMAKPKRVAEEAPPIRHISGQELCVALKHLAHQQYGLMAKLVLASCGIHATSDFGEIVYNLIRIGKMSKSDHDRREDFDDVYDFERALVREYCITTEEETCRP